MNVLDPGARAPRRPRVGLACDEVVRARYVDDADVARLEAVADFSYEPFSIGPDRRGPARRDRAAEADLGAFAADLDALVVCHGSPFVGAEVLDMAPGLRFLGELEGDRFAHRIDIEAATTRRLCVVDTTHGSSWPTAEWALGLALVGRRNAGAYFRRMIADETAFVGGQRPSAGLGYDDAELSGKRVGMIGFGHLARRLVELLEPFHVDIVAFDPFVPRELAEACGVAFGPLARVLDCDVVCNLAPLTPGTAGMIGAAELELLRPGATFVSVSRGQVLDSAALTARAERGDVVFCLDVFDPEPVPVDSPVLDLPNVFLSPHLGGVTEESRRRFFSLMVDECLRHFAGLEPRNELSPHVVRLRNSGRPGPVASEGHVKI